MTVPWSEAKRKLEALVQTAAHGENVLIQLEDGGFVQISKASEKRRVRGSAKGQIWMSDDFDEPLEENMQLVTSDDRIKPHAVPQLDARA
jgi:antitoxin (DNA-binding transcriptional repressor) of toxin-antitoxin stability system